MNSKYKIDRRTKDSSHFVKSNERSPISSQFKLDKRIPQIVNNGPILRSRFCKINKILSLKERGDSSIVKSASTSCQSSQQQQAALKIVSKYKLKNNVYMVSPTKNSTVTGKTTKHQNTTINRQNSTTPNRFKIRGTFNSRYKLVKSSSTVKCAPFRNGNYKYCKLNSGRKSNDKFKKTNLGSSTRKLCPYYIRLGKCKLGQRCPLYHDISTVMICPKFLKNQCCDSPRCCLSHEYSKDKMPLCHFFLKGACGRSNCPYLHIKHKKDASVCLKFKAGYCPNGAKCGMLHLERCQDNKLVYRRKSITSKPKSSEMQKRIASRRLSRKIEKSNHSTDTICDDANSQACLLPSFIKLPDNPLKLTVSTNNNRETMHIIPSFLKF
uniref:C3H1-type domain-containing protein n=1 Tax=Romanomermis culicivorax TaxID=13658 RepID=A0A915JWB8_ROMCU